MSEEPKLPSPGQIVAERYRVEKQLGEGGMGAVYRAVQLGLEREIALKVILPHKAESQQSRDRFLREARISASLRHPGIVEIFDFGEVGGTLYLAMELLRGESLREWVDYDKPPLSLERSLNIATQIAEVLAFAAERGAVHRDLKPENVIYDRDGDRERVVVVDFGLAFIQAGDDTTGRLTREGVVTGTPDYMSPEQCRGKANVTSAADIYSLGCMMYEMLTANVPFNGDVGIVISRHLFVQPKPMREAYPELHIPGAIDDLVRRMLAKTPEDRPTATEVLRSLGAYDPSTPRRFSGRDQNENRVGRAARMVSVHAKAPTAPAPRPAGMNCSIAWVGERDDNIATGLAVNGVAATVYEPSAIPEDIEAILASGQSLDVVTALCSKGVPVVADAEPGDTDRLQALLRAGVAEVLVRPWNAGSLAQKTLRAVRKAKRKRSPKKNS